MARKGSVLITVLWLMVLLSLFAASMGFRMHLETRLMSRTLNRQEMRERLESSIQFARYLIESDPHPDFDYPGDAWDGVHPLGDWLPGETVEITVQDEERKININLATPALLKTLIDLLRSKGIPLETGTEELVASIAQWRGDTALFGIPSSYPNKKGPFESLEELLLAEHITQKDYEALAPYLTVFSAKGERNVRVNLNTAPEEIIEALVRNSPGDEFSKKNFLAALLQCLRDARDGKQFFFRQKDLPPSELLRRINLPASVQFAGLASQFLQNITVNSTYFSVTACDTASKVSGSRVLAVIGPTLGRMASSYQATYQGPAFFRSDSLEILSWREHL